MLVPIIMGSKVDMPHAQKIADMLKEASIDTELKIASAHKDIRRLLDILERYEADERTKVYITIAGRSNALSGIVDANVTAPVIACPVYSDKFGGADILSSLRMPSGVAPAVVLEPESAALLAIKILSLADGQNKQGFYKFDATKFGPATSGKVRDMYLLPADEKRVLIVTDRVSAFDKIIGTIPHKGQVLNQLSAWWFEQLIDIIPNHLVSVSDANVSIVRDADPLPVEVVVRGYITGSTSTALWTLYDQGVKNPYGLSLPAGLKKNGKLPEPVITPTTKAKDGNHDETLTCAEVVERGLIGKDLWQEIQRVALLLFERGQSIALKADLLLVDTKYEFGLIDHKLTLIDEVHTPDSSRYWDADAYLPGIETQSFDKEILRLWLIEQGYRGEGTPPPIPASISTLLSDQYINLYERLTGEIFVPGEEPVSERIKKVLSA